MGRDGYRSRGVSVDIHQSSPRLYRPQNEPVIDHAHIGQGDAYPVEDGGKVAHLVYLRYDHEIRCSYGGQADSGR